MVTLAIDGQTIQVPKGTTVLEAAQQLDIEIPTLCYHEALSPQGACRVCIVEMQASKRGKTYNWIDAACVYPAEEGLQVETNSPKVQRERKLILELLLSKSPDSPALNALAERYGADRKAFVAVDQGAANCILCGLCVRVCNELVGANAIGMAERGVEKQVVTPYQIAQSQCIGCRACEYVCPTGVITVMLDEAKLKIGKWEVALDLKNCVSCGKPVAPAVYLQQLQARAKHLRPDILERCPECRRKEERVTQ